MKSKKVSASAIFLVFLIFAIIMVYITILLSNMVINTNNYFKDYNNSLSNDLLSQLNYQDKVDEKIKDMVKNGTCSLNSPCVMQDPYGISPLSALLVFNTLTSESVSIYINDELVTKDDESTSHIIPIVGLYSNTNNVVSLESSSGEVSNVTISTDSFDTYINDFDINNIISNNYKSVLIMGNISNNNSIIRGFDSYGNLNNIITFGYLNGMSVKNNHIYVNYNTMINSNTLGIVLEMDYLGRIYSIDIDNSSLLTSSNLSLDGSEYITISTNYYSDVTDAYSLNKTIDNREYTIFKTINTESITNLLNDASVYDEDFNLSLMGDYLSYNFNEKLTLVVVNRYNNLTYLYDVDGEDIIKINIPDDASLFVIKDNKYYSLLTVLDNN
jgi:hypothetical protein